MKSGFQNAVIAGKNVKPSTYHANGKRGEKDFVMHSGALNEFYRCPHKWINGFERADSPSLKWGRMLDCLISSVEQFEKRYVNPPETYVNSKGDEAAWTLQSKTCRAWVKEQEDLGFEVVSADSVVCAGKAKNQLLQVEDAGEILTNSDFQVMVTADYFDKATNTTIPCKCLLDIVPKIGSRFDRTLLDLKTARSANPNVWPEVVFGMGYHVQAAFYLDMYVAATGEDRVDWRWLISENIHPWEANRALCSEEMLKLGRTQYRSALAEYADDKEARHEPP